MLPKPLAKDKTPFGVWLRQQTKRRDNIGGFARAAAQDPHWPCPKTLAQLEAYFNVPGPVQTRDFVIITMRAAWHEFQADQKLQQQRAKAKAAKKARRANRRR